MNIQPEMGTSDTPKTTIIILAKVGENEIPIGAIQHLSITETKEEDADGNPKGIARVNGVASRIRFDKHRLEEAFSRGFVHAHAQKIPIHFIIGGDAGLMTKICNVWITKIDWSYIVAEWVIVDEMEWEAEKIEVVTEKINT